MSGPGEAMRRWRVGLIDDHPLFGVALERLLDEADDLEWVGASPTVVDFLARTPLPEVAVLDLRLDDRSTPYDNVIALQDRNVNVIVYTSGENPELVRSAARAGVLGVVLKSESPMTTLKAIRAAARGEAIVTTQWATALDGDDDMGAVDLSPQLQRILTRYASGETAPAIATALGIATDTVNDHLERIRLKYTRAGRPTRSKLDVFKRALEDGFVPFPRRRRTIR